MSGKMSESGEHPILPPESEQAGWRYESADLDVEALYKWLADTKFESESDVEDLLSSKYKMGRDDSIEEIETGMTRIWDFKEILDILDPKKLLPRTRDDIVESVKKIRKAMIDKRSHVIIGSRGFFITDDIKERLSRASFSGEPLSGRDPQAVLRTNIKTIDGGDYDLRIFRVYNRNQHFRYAYILLPRQIDSE